MHAYFEKRKSIVICARQKKIFHFAQLIKNFDYLLSKFTDRDLVKQSTNTYEACVLNKRETIEQSALNAGYFRLHTFQYVVLTHKYRFLVLV